MQHARAEPANNFRALRELEGAFRIAREGDRRTLPKAARPAEDWSTTLGLVDRTAEALRQAEDRIRDLEEKCEQLRRVTKSRLQAAKASLEAAHARAEKAESRADEAEAQAAQAREWLARIHNGLKQLPTPTH